MRVSNPGEKGITPGWTPHPPCLFIFSQGNLLTQGVEIRGQEESSGLGLVSVSLGWGREDAVWCCQSSQSLNQNTQKWSENFAYHFISRPQLLSCVYKAFAASKWVKSSSVEAKYLRKDVMMLWWESGIQGTLGWRDPDKHCSLSVSSPTWP